MNDSSKVQHNKREKYSCVHHVLIFVVVLVVYASTAFPSVPGGDAGELLAEGCIFGTAHPPGYPLYTMLNHLIAVYVAPLLKQWAPLPPNFDICPTAVVGSVAWSINLMSCCLGAGAATMIAIAVETWTIDTKAYSPGAAATSAFIFAFSPLTWEYSTGAEVFSLNNFLVSALILSAAKLGRNPTIYHGMQGACISGLCLAHQHSSILTVIPLVMWAGWRLWKAGALRSIRNVCLLSVCFLVTAVGPYAYLWVASQKANEGSWGDMRTLQGLLKHIMRSEYGTFRLGPGASSTENGFERSYIYLKDAARQLSFITPILALCGFMWSILSSTRWLTLTHEPRTAATTTNKKSHNNDHKLNGSHVVEERAGSIGMMLGLAWFTYVVIWHGVLSNLSLSIPMAYAVHQRFWMQPNILLCVLAGGGAGALRGFIIPKGSIPLPGVLWDRCGTLLSFAIGAALARARWSQMDRSSYDANTDYGSWAIHRRGQAILAAMPKSALLLSHTDLDWNPTRYLRLCEGMRRDVRHISLQIVPYPWFRPKQEALYKKVGVKIPPNFPGVSTQRHSEGNAHLIDGIVMANIPKRQVFLDMQAIHEGKVEGVGGYRNFTLLPWGPVYRVIPRINAQQTESYHAGIMQQIKILRRCSGPAPTERYPAGTWEFAASSVFYDAIYATALFLLSYALEMNAAISTRPEIFGRYIWALRTSTSLLAEVLDAVDKHGTLSQPMADLVKNATLAATRLQAVLEVAFQFKGQLNLTEDLDNKETTKEELMNISELSVKLLHRFLQEQPNDKDAPAFIAMLNRLRGNTVKEKREHLKQQHEQERLIERQEL